MIPFSDDQLRLLKEWVNDKSDKTFPDRREIKPLIRRLEAAERIIGRCAWPYDKNYEAWRKSKGE